MNNKSEEQEGPGTSEKQFRIKSFFWLAHKKMQTGSARHLQLRNVYPDGPQNTLPRGGFGYIQQVSHNLCPLSPSRRWKNQVMRAVIWILLPKGEMLAGFQVFTWILNVDTEGRQQSRTPNSPRDTQPSPPGVMGRDIGVSQRGAPALPRHPQTHQGTYLGRAGRQSRARHSRAGG